MEIDLGWIWWMLLTIILFLMIVFWWMLDYIREKDKHIERFEERILDAINRSYRDRD